MQQRCNSVLNGKAESARKNPACAREQIALVQKQNGTYHRWGRANTKRRGAGIDDEVLEPEELLQCARVPASPRFSILEHPWPALL